MKKLLFLLSIGMLFLCHSAAAQKVNTDSLKLVAQISQDQLKLGKLQNTVGQKTKNKRDAAANAQNSADNNANAAEQLSADPTNKTLARNADNKAGDAKSDSKKSRKKTAELDDLNKDILDLKKKIAAEEVQLSAYGPTAPGPYVTPVAMPVQPDTARGF